MFNKRFIKLKNIFVAHKKINFAILLLLLFIFNDFAKLLKVNYDHLLFDNNTFIGTIKQSYMFTVVGQARPNFISPITTAFEYINSDYYYVWTIFYVFFTGLIGCLIVKEITNSKSFMYLSFILIIAYSVISLEPISVPSAYALVLGFGILTLLLSIYFTFKYNKTNLYKFKLLAVFCILLSIFDYEINPLYIPVLVGINYIYSQKKSIKDNWNKSKEFIFVGLFYICVYFITKSVYGIGNYVGTQIGKLEFILILKNFIKIFIATIPGFFFFYDKSFAYSSPIHDVYVDKNVLGNIQYLLNTFLSLRMVISVVLFLLILYKIYLIYVKERQSAHNLCKGKIRYISTGLILYSIIIPIIPYVLTFNTQKQIEERWRLVGICNQYSFVFLIIGLVCFLYYFRFKVINNRINLIFAVFIVTTLFVMTSIVNKNSADIINILGMRFKQFDIIINDISQTVDDNGIIFTNTLKTSSGLMSIPNSYYSDRFFYKTKKKIIVTSNIDDIKKKETVYFLRYLYTDNFTNTLFILSKQTAQEIVDYYKFEESFNKESLYSKEVKVFSFSKVKNYSIVGRNLIISNAVQAHKDNVTITSSNFFEYPVKSKLNNFKKPLILSINDKTTDVMSIFSLPQYMSTVQKLEKINPYQIQ